MKRRDALVALAGVAASPWALGQAAMRRIAILEYGGTDGRGWAEFDARMRGLGYVEGSNIAIDRRHEERAEERLPALARELLSLKPEVVIVATTPATRALMRLTTRVPIVMTGTADPVATGLVASLARPGGNVTGVSMQLSDAAVKRFELLREIKPALRRIAMLGPAHNAGIQAVLQQTRNAARTHGVEVRVMDAADPPAIERAFEQLKQEPVDVIMITQIMLPHRVQIAELALRARLPTAFVDEPALDAGGLLVFGPDRAQLYRHVADYTHQILHGAKPAELAIVQPTKFWLGVNLRTARALGLKVPSSVLLRADRVIE